ncbi:hypothetical protein GCM10010358_48850 [Streptomyces minutiscleroticus]|uniref:Uncharacterized protein n=1 Tax=Streptomyces minutiscleroticus TaxID=68238 RepID=A0A918U4B6_9ACTN|nr:hypothetical protein GCM10010358_48850 [Streptomyces minutiscleroticus]
MGDIARLARQIICTTVDPPGVFARAGGTADEAPPFAPVNDHQCTAHSEERARAARRPLTGRPASKKARNAHRFPRGLSALPANPFTGTIRMPNFRPADGIRREH